jgi:hypothetical protein
MTTLVLIAITISLLTVGIYATTWKGMIFHKPAKYIKNRLPEWVCKPLFSCPVCMASVWSLVFFAVFGLPEWPFIPVVILMVAGLNTVIVSLIINIIPDKEE